MSESFKEPKTLLQNENYLIVDKPVGWSVHNQDQSPNLLEYFLNKGLHVLPIHRLDKETSGVQIFALNEEWARKLSTSFQSRTVKKNYVAVLCGALKQDHGIWKDSLSDKAEGRKNPAGLSEDRIHCETEFQVLEKNKYFSLVQFNLITGRQHQIRKHSVLNGHALLGDERYGNPKYNEKMAQIYGVSRMFLHCENIQMQDLELTAQAERPLDFDQLMKKSGQV